MKSVVFQAAVETSFGTVLIESTSPIQPRRFLHTKSASPIHVALPMARGISLNPRDPWPLGDSACRIDISNRRSFDQQLDNKSYTEMLRSRPYVPAGLSPAEKTLADLRSKFAGDAPPEMPLSDIITATIEGYQTAHDEIVVERDQLREDNALLRQHASPEWL